jgi:hypothetical protein
MFKLEITEEDVDAAMRLHWFGRSLDFEIGQILEALIVVATKRYCVQMSDAGFTIDQMNARLRELDLRQWQQQAHVTLMSRINERHRAKLN